MCHIHVQSLPYPSYFCMPQWAMEEWVPERRLGCAGSTGGQAMLTHESGNGTTPKQLMSDRQFTKFENFKPANFCVLIFQYTFFFLCLHFCNPQVPLKGITLKRTREHSFTWKQHAWGPWLVEAGCLELLSLLMLSACCWDQHMSVHGLRFRQLHSQCFNKTMLGQDRDKR